MDFLSRLKGPLFVLKGVQDIELLRVKLFCDVQPSVSCFSTWCLIVV